MTGAQGMMTPDQDGVYARVVASPARRVFAVATLAGLGVLLALLVVIEPISGIWNAVLLAMGFGCLWLADWLRRATRLSIDLTEDGLRDSSGRVLAAMADVVRVERGVFAFKPSNGFTLVLRKRQPRAWAPGLWWRVGRRVGVGGVLPSGPAKFMAEMIAMRIDRS
jgi:hypothetical protein